MRRPRLFERLDALAAAPLAWISGPPGAGKTTLVSSYLMERGLTGLWFQLDAGDVDVATFFHYLGLAARAASPQAPRELPTLTPDYLAGLMGFTRRYAEALAACVPLPAVIVLDNAEAIPAQAPLHEVLRELASSLPEGLRLIVLSRRDPPAAYARLRLNQALRVIDGRELDLTREEAFELASARHGQPARQGAISPDDDALRIDRLLQQTQGWVAGFVLLLADLADLGDTQAAGTNPKTRQLLFDYFATELLGRFDPAVRIGLLRSALLPTMTAASAQAIAGDAAIGAVLADLHRQNCFVARRGRPPWEAGDAAADATEATDATAEYEYHALFREFLLNRAAATIPPDAWRALQCRVAEGLAASHQADAAADLYRQAGAWPGLAALVRREARALLAAGRHRSLQQWMADLPEAMVEQSPWLAYWRAAAWLPFEPVRARADLERAYAGFEASDDTEGLYSAWAGAMESFFFEWRDFRPADRWIAEFARLHARHPEFSSRAVELRTYWAMGTLLHRQPQHPLLPAWSERALTLLDAGNRDLSVVLGGYLLIWLSWRGETHRARHILERVTPWIAPGMSPVVSILWSCAVGFLHSVSGDIGPCRQAIEAGLDLAQRSGLHNLDFLLSAQMARCCLVAGEATEAERWMAAMAGTMRSPGHFDGAFHRHLQCNLALQRGQWQLALDHGEGALRLAHEAGVPFLEATCHISLARALTGDASGAPFTPREAACHADHIAAARAVGLAMASRVVECLCLEAEAAAALRHGDDRLGLACLTRALAESRLMDGATWRVGGPRANALLYDRALGAGIEVDHVQQLIRRHAIRPRDPAAAAEAWPWPIRVYTLGRFEIVCEDVPLRSAGKPQHKPLELLQCLCALGGIAINQDRVTDALWPDTEGDAADQALRTTLHRLRKLLRCDEAVRIENRHLHLDAQRVWVDALAFDRSFHRFIPHPKMSDRASLQHAMNRYRGPFLDGESAPWAVACRDRLHAHFIGMVERLGDLHEQAGDWPGAAQCWLRGIEVEPLAEDFYRRLMRAYTRLGRRPEALATYERCRRTMLARHGVSPMQETQALYRELGR